MLQSCAGFITKTAAARAAVALAALLSASAAGHAGPFNDFYGTWSGRGNAIFNGGAREALMCKGYYTGKDSDLRLALRCASPSNKIDLRAKLVGSGKKVSGTWEERTFGAEGEVSGALNGKSLQVKLEGGITGTMKLSLGSNTQLVSLNTEGSTLTGVQLKLKRR